MYIGLYILGGGKRSIYFKLIKYIAFLTSGSYDGPYLFGKCVKNNVLKYVNMPEHFVRKHYALYIFCYTVVIELICLCASRVMYVYLVCQSGYSTAV